MWKDLLKKKERKKRWNRVNVDRSTAFNTSPSIRFHLSSNSIIKIHRSPFNTFSPSNLLSLFQQWAIPEVVAVHPWISSAPSLCSSSSSSFPSSLRIAPSPTSVISAFFSSKMYTFHFPFFFFFLFLLLLLFDLDVSFFLLLFNLQFQLRILS